MNETSKRIAIFPYGQPVDEERRTKCVELLIFCGADLQRFIDGPWSSDERLVRIVSFLDEVADGSRPPFMVLTQSNPLALKVLAARRRWCRELPNLNRAMWVIFVDPVAEPFFYAEAQRLGQFDAQPDPNKVSDSLMVWSVQNQDAKRQERFLVLTPQTVKDDYFQARLALLWNELNSIQPVQFLPEEPSSASSTFRRVVPNGRKL